MTRLTAPAILFLTAITAQAARPDSIEIPTYTIRFASADGIPIAGMLSGYTATSTRTYFGWCHDFLPGKCTDIHDQVTFKGETDSDGRLVCQSSQLKVANDSPRLELHTGGTPLPFDYLGPNGEDYRATCWTLGLAVYDGQTLGAERKCAPSSIKGKRRIQNPKYDVISCRFRDSLSRLRELQIWELETCRKKAENYAHRHGGPVPERLMPITPY